MLRCGPRGGFAIGPGCRLMLEADDGKTLWRLLTLSFGGWLVAAVRDCTFP